jgi:hypothetical protein
MLTHPTLDQLNQLGLFGMAKAFDPATPPRFRTLIGLRCCSTAR